MNEKPTHLDLFSGIGGFALAARWAGFETIGFCEIDKYCQQVLAKNFDAQIEGSDGIRTGSSMGSRLSPMAETERVSLNVPDDSINGCRSRRAGRSDSSGARESEQTFPMFGDIKNLDGKQFAGVDLVTGGFPCQPFSCAGKRRGKEDDRHLWPEMLRVITEARPAWVLGENVAGIIGMELDTVLSDLEAAGYSTRPFVIPACGVDARHRRNRVWIVAHRNEPRSQRRDGAIMRECADEWIAGTSDSSLAHDASAGLQHGSEMQTGCELAERNAANGSSINSSDADESRLSERQRQNPGRSRKNCGTIVERSVRWQPEPDVGRVANGIPARVDRLRGLGNSIVPQVAYQIMRAIREQMGAGTNPAPKIE